MATTLKQKINIEIDLLLASEHQRDTFEKAFKDIAYHIAAIEAYFKDSHAENEISTILEINDVKISLDEVLL